MGHPASRGASNARRKPHPPTTPRHASPAATSAQTPTPLAAVMTGLWAEGAALADRLRLAPPPLSAYRAPALDLLRQHTRRGHPLTQADRAVLRLRIASYFRQ